MYLLTLGLNHRTAPVALRERTAFSPEQLPDAVRSLVANPQVQEATILSTCNRTEIYCRQEQVATAPVFNWLREYGDLPEDALNSSTYTLPGTGSPARLSCGLGFGFHGAWRASDPRTDEIRLFRRSPGRNYRQDS